MPENDYQILQVDETMLLDAAGNPRDGYKVWFIWPGGRKAHIEMLKEVATSELRDQLIEAEIARQEMLWG